MKTIAFIALMMAGCALGWSADWLAGGNDPERTHWQKDEKTISPANAKNMKLLWKLQLDSKPRVMSNLFDTLVAGKVTTKAGPKQIALEAGVSDDLFAIDADKGTILWSKHYTSDYDGPAPGQDPLCPGGQTAIPVIAPNGPGKYTIYSVSWDGMLHQINLADGEDVAPPVKFVPPNGKTWALNLYKGVIYTHTSQGCGGNPNHAYAFDLATKKVGNWGPAGGGMWGRTGPAISPTTGAMYTGTGDGVWNPEAGVYGNGIIGLKQDPQTKELKLFDMFGPPNADWLGEARSGRAGDAGHLPVQGQGTHGERQQGMPPVDDGHRVDRRRRPSHGSLHDTDVLQRRRELRLGRHLGLAGDVARFEGHPLGAEPVLGSGAFAVQISDHERRHEKRRNRGVQSGRRERQDCNWCRPGFRAIWIRASRR